MEHPLCLADVPQGPGSFKGCRLCDDHQVAPEPAPARGRDSAGSAGVSLWPLVSPGEICFQWKLSNIYKSKRNSLMKRLMQFLLSLHLCPPPVYFEKQILDITLFHLSWYKIRTLKRNHSRNVIPTNANKQTQALDQDSAVLRWGLEPPGSGGQSARGRPAAGLSLSIPSFFTASGSRGGK